MGIGKRLLDLARANLNALLDRAAGREMSDDELDKELERRKQRREQEAKERDARDRAESRAREQRKRPRPPTPSQEKRMRELYAQLETPYGAPLEEVKKSFRRLMRKYHPDFHVQNPKKHKAATALSMELTRAMSELEELLAR